MQKIVGRTQDDVLRFDPMGGGERSTARDKDLPCIVDGSQSRLVVHEHRRVSPRGQRDGPALHLAGQQERVRGLALRVAAKPAGPHEHRAVRLADDFHHSLSAVAVLDVSETHKVCEIRRAFGDVPVVSCREGPDGCAGMPGLVVSRLLDAEGS